MRWSADFQGGTRFGVPRLSLPAKPPTCSTSDTSDHELLAPSSLRARFDRAGAVDESSDSDQETFRQAGGADIGAVRRERDWLRRRLHEAAEEIDALQRDRDETSEALLISERKQRRSATAEGGDHLAGMWDRVQRLERERDAAVMRERAAEERLRQCEVHEDLEAQLSIACQTERDLRQQVGSLQDDISQLQCCLSESKEETAEAVDRLHVVEILLTRQREDALAASRKAGETAEQVQTLRSQLASLRTELMESRAREEDAAVLAHQHSGRLGAERFQLRGAVIQCLSARNAQQLTRVLYAWRYFAGHPSCVAAQLAERKVFSHSPVDTQLDNEIDCDLVGRELLLCSCGGAARPEVSSWAQRTPERAALQEGPTARQARRARRSWAERHVDFCRKRSAAGLVQTLAAWRMMTWRARDRRSAVERSQALVSCRGRARPLAACFGAWGRRVAAIGWRQEAHRSVSQVAALAADRMALQDHNATLLERLRTAQGTVCLAKKRQEDAEKCLAWWEAPGPQKSAFFPEVRRIEKDLENLRREARSAAWEA